MQLLVEGKSATNGPRASKNKPYIELVSTQYTLTHRNCIVLVMDSII